MRYARRGPCRQSFLNPPSSLVGFWRETLEAHCFNTPWVVQDSVEVVCFSLPSSVPAGGALLNVLLSVYQENISLQDGITLLLWLYDHPEDTNINLLYLSYLAGILITPFFTFVMNISSWDPGGTFVFSFFSPICFSYCFWFLLSSKFSLPQISSVHNKHTDWGTKSHTSSLALHMLSWEPRLVTLETTVILQDSIFSID